MRRPGLHGNQLMLSVDLLHMPDCFGASISKSPNATGITSEQRKDGNMFDDFRGCMEFEMDDYAQDIDDVLFTIREIVWLFQ